MQARKSRRTLAIVGFAAVAWGAVMLSRPAARASLAKIWGGGAGTELADEGERIEVSITSHDGTPVQLAAVDGLSPNDLRWFDAQPGMNKLRPGAYQFRTTADGREKIGLIAVNDATPIVIK